MAYVFKGTIKVDDSRLGSFYSELHEVLIPCGKFTVNKDDTYSYARIEIEVPQDYGVQFETFLDKWFGNGTSEEWRQETVEEAYDGDPE